MHHSNRSRNQKFPVPTSETKGAALNQQSGFKGGGTPEPARGGPIESACVLSR